MGASTRVTGADLIDSEGNIHCFMLPMSSCNINICVLSQFRILVVVKFMNTQLFFFKLTTCTRDLLDSVQGTALH